MQVRVVCGRRCAEAPAGDRRRRSDTAAERVRGDVEERRATESSAADGDDRRVRHLAGQRRLHRAHHHHVSIITMSVAPGRCVVLVVLIVLQQEQRVRCHRKTQRSQIHAHNRITSCHAGVPLPDSRQCLSNEDCLGDKKEDHQNCSVLCCV